MHTRQYSASIKRIDTFQWCIIQAPNPCSFPVPADTSFLMESSKKVGKKQKWRLLKVKISSYFYNYRTKHQNPLPSLPLLKHLKKTPLACTAYSIFIRRQNTVKESDWLPPQPTPQLWFCFMIEEICLPLTCLYQVTATAQEGLISLSSPEEDSTNLGISPSNPKASYLIFTYILSSLPTPHILNKLTSVRNTIPTVTWWSKH